MAPENLSALSDQLVLFAMVGYAVSALLLGVEFAFRRGWTGTAGVLTAGAGLAANLGAAAARALAVDRVPWGNMFEYSVMVAAVLVAGFLTWSARRREVRAMGAFFLLPALLVIGAGRFALYAEAGPLMPALQSGWIAIHVLAAILGSSILTLASVFSVLYLIRERYERAARPPLVAGAARTADPVEVSDALSRYGAATKGDATTAGPATVDPTTVDPTGSPRPTGRAAKVSRVVRALATRLPEARTLDLLAYRTTVLGFPIWTFAVVAGAIWAQAAWGRYWGWDPKETWSFITWVVYACYLHARATAGWRAHRAAWIAVVGLGATIVNFYVINTVAKGLHSYSGL